MQIKIYPRIFVQGRKYSSNQASGIGTERLHDRTTARLHDPHSYGGLKRHQIRTGLSSEFLISPDPH